MSAAPLELEGDAGRGHADPVAAAAAAGVRVIIGTAMAAAALYAPFYFDPVYNRLLSQAIYLAIAAMGLNLLTGFNGQVSIDHGFFYGVSAFTSASSWSTTAGRSRPPSRWRWC